MLSQRFGARWSERRIFFSILSQRFGTRYSERMDFFSILSRRFGARWSERMELFFHPLTKIWRQVEIHMILNATSPK
jgi:hypothetical protein